jgi:hypothetical protein
VNISKKGVSFSKLIFSPNCTTHFRRRRIDPLYLRRGSRNRSFSGMAKSPRREMAADDGALTNLRVKQFRTVRSRTEPTPPKNIMNRIIEADLLPSNGAT